MSACCPANAEPTREAAPSDIDAMKSSGRATFYQAGPAHSRVGLLGFTDIYGPESGRSKQDADHLGRLGYAVLLLDLTDGDWIGLQPTRDGMLEWLRKYDFDSYLGPRIDDAVEYLKSGVGVEQLVSYGYCWGAWVGARLSAREQPVIQGHVSFHPSWHHENTLHGDGEAEKLAERVGVPQLLLSASNDADFVRANGSVHKILANRPVTVSAHSDVVDFPDVNHGWVIRGDLEQPEVKAAVAKAWHAAVKFFQTVAIAPQ